MSAGLIKHLRKKTDEDSNTKILMSQWEFDEKLVGKSLENVGSYYPHFSSHNESHSQQILVNIERLLGSNIEKLTATDTWLILEAAYWHDIGMLFNTDEVQDVIEDDSFKDYVEELASNNVQDLHEFAKVWHNDGWEAALVHYDNPYKGVEKYRQMVAEWYRKGHAKNSNDVVLKPFEKLNISSPRTELLPKRIYRYLGQICWAHGRDFENYVMQTLPFRQTGMGTENCHPRFVACLLRLGDLFDIDDNRFCPVMARQVGNMPSLSKTHEHKHQAIREFQLDNETVSITAICSTEMAYIECRNWFDWIKEEIQNQMSQWKNIVPSREFGLLPTINKLDVEMDDSKILLNDKPMKFSLDERSAIELLQGKNLYDDEINIYRELFQNAIDATYIRVWTEFGGSSPKPKLNKQSNPYSEEFSNVIRDYPISVSFTKIKDENDSDYSIWKFSINDMGTGISIKDLEYMQKIAGSSKNLERKKIINDMPLSIRPSGTFGIGLHSAFLLLEGNEFPYNKVYIETRSIFDSNSYNIEMTSPISNNQGYCFIEKIDSNTSRSFGTTLSVYLRLKRRGMRYNSHLFNPNDEEKLVDEVQNSYDPIEQPIFDYLQIITKIGDIKKKIIKNTPVPVSLNKDFNNYDSISRHKDELIWDSKYNLFFGVFNCEEVSFLKGPSYRLNNLFKGQSVEPLASFFIMPIFIDFYGFDARDALQLDRNKWRKEFQKKMDRNEYFEDLIEHLLKNHLEAIRNQLKNDKFLSSILSIFSIEDPRIDNDLWTELSLFDDSEVKFSSDLKDKHSFKELLKLPKLDIIKVNSKNDHNYVNFNTNSYKKTIMTTNFKKDSIWTNKFLEKWYLNSGYMVSDESNKDMITYSFKRSSGVENNLLMLLCQDFLNDDNSRMSLSKSSLKRANLDKFTYLCCFSKAHKNIFGKDNTNVSEECFLLPFTKLFKNDKKHLNTYNLETLIDLVFEDLKQENLSLNREQVEKSYKEIIVLVDETMKDDMVWKKARKRGEGFEPHNISELQKRYNFK